MKRNRSGFAALEGLLILIIVAIIGGAGWFVWHSRVHSYVPQNNAGTSSSIKASDRKVTTSIVPKSYFTIPEWGVRAPYNGSLHLQYRFNESTTMPTAVITSEEACAADPAYCQNAGGTLTKATTEGHLHELLYSMPSGAEYISKQIGANFFVYIPVAGAQTAIESKTLTDVKEIMSNLEASP